MPNSFVDDKHVDDVIWHRSEFKIEYDEYRKLKYAFINDTYANVKNAKLYWIEDLNYPLDIFSGYIGVTKDCINKRFDKHLKRQEIQESIELHGYDNVKVSLIATGSYYNILKLERYFRYLPHIGWNKSTGGTSGCGWRNVDKFKSAFSFKERNANLKKLGISTSNDRTAETNRLNDLKRKANGERTRLELASLTKLSKFDETIQRLHPELLQRIILISTDNQITETSIIDLADRRISKAKQYHSILVSNDEYRFKVGRLKNYKTKFKPTNNEPV